MVVSEIPRSTEVLVIGGGPGGYAAAIRAGQLGKDVILVEREDLGGLCLNHGCIPSKALIFVSDFYYELSRLEDVGIKAKGEIDIVKLQGWKDGIVRRLRLGIAGLCKKYGVEVIKGEAHFDSSSRAEVAGLGAIDFKKAVIATGTRPKILPGFEFGRENVISSREALQIKEVPRDIIIIGTEYISVTLGTMFAKLGTRVKVVQKPAHILPRIDPEVSEVVKKKMEKLGIEFYLNSEPEKLKSSGGRAVVTITSKDRGSLDLEADKVLIAMGREPYYEGLGIDKTKVELDRKGYIRIDEKRQTTDPNIYAVGDVTGTPATAHKAYREGKVAAEAIAGLPSVFDPRAIPTSLSSDPEVAFVGLNEKDAVEKGIKVRTGRFPFRALGRAVAVHQGEGFVKIVAEETSNIILGVQIVGKGASDMIGEASLAIEMGTRLEDLALTIHPHPTLSEALQEAAEAALGKSIHI